MSELVPYLNYDGTCAEALRFYEHALGAKIEALIRGADTPIAAQLSPEQAGRVMHGRLRLPGGGVLYAGDSPTPERYPGIHGVRITLNFDTIAQATEAFNGLAQGGEITMPLQQTFWAAVSGAVTDGFGVPWIINGELHPVGTG